MIIDKMVNRIILFVGICISILGCRSDNLANKFARTDLIEKGKLSLYFANCGQEIYFRLQDSVYTRISESCMIEFVDSVSLNDTIWTYFEYKDPQNLNSIPYTHYGVIYLRKSELPCAVGDLMYIKEHGFSCREKFNPSEYEKCISQLLKTENNLSANLKSALEGVP